MSAHGMASTTITFGLVAVPVIRLLQGRRVV